ncbi:MAG TPA: thioesterase family protein [Vicinamibacterales bacterium]|nr:thioesterase family protein [Vicinamibacterales bacterium]
MENAPFSHQVEVRFRDCDPMGHVNHAVYLTYLEQARFAYWRQLTRSRPGPGAGIIIARAECDFRASILMGETIDVRLWVSAIGRSSFTLDYEVLRLDDSKVVATARTVIVAYDYQANRPVPIPDDMRALLEQARRDPVGR